MSRLCATRIHHHLLALHCRGWVLFLNIYIPRRCFYFVIVILLLGCNGSQGYGGTLLRALPPNSCLLTRNARADQDACVLHLNSSK